MAEAREYGAVVRLLLTKGVDTGSSTHAWNGGTLDRVGSWRVAVREGLSTLWVLMSCTSAVHPS